MKTFQGKNHYGHFAETNIELGNGMTLKIQTSKRYNGSLCTTATCFKRNGIGETHRVYQDMYADVFVTYDKRVTANAVSKQHSKALELADFYRDQAIKHYSSPEYKAKYPDDEYITA